MCYFLKKLTSWLWYALCSVSWTPSFLLKRYVLTGIRDGPHEPFIADSVDFVVSQVEFVKVYIIMVLAIYLVSWSNLSLNSLFQFSAQDETVFVEVNCTYW